jgi:hypothetical protein
VVAVLLAAVLAGATFVAARLEAAVFAAVADFAADLAGAFAAGAATSAMSPSGTAFTGRLFLSVAGTGAVAVRRAALVAGMLEGLEGAELGVVTGDTDDLPGRWREMSGDRKTAKQWNAEGMWGMPE